MAVFSTNQVRHLYVVKAVKAEGTALANKGDATVLADVEGNVCIKHLGAGGVTRTDLINPKLVAYAKHTAAADLQEKPKKVTVTVAEAVEGANYLLSVTLSQYIGLSDDDRVVKYGVATAKSDSVSDLLKDLAISLAKNLSKEPQKSLKVTVGTVEVTGATKVADLPETASSIVIEAIEQPWTRGLNAGRLAQFTVNGVPVTINGHDVNWATIVEGVSSTVIGDGKKIADLEYFCMGDRADLYRGMAWPHIVPTEYLVDETKEYDVIDIQYAFAGTCEDSQLSEKTLTIVGESTAIAAVITALAAKGITVKTKTTTVDADTEEKESSEG